MIYLFDMDGTITEPWYGETAPDFYEDLADMTMRSYTENTYKFVRPLPCALDFIKKIEKYHENHTKPTFAVLTTIVNGKEYVDKVEYLSKNFKDTDGNALFDIDRVYGVVSNENKVEVINALLTEDDVVFFDDTIGILNEVRAKCNSSVCQYYHCLALHSTALYMRTMEDIVTAFETETHENYPR